MSEILVGLLIGLVTILVIIGLVVLFVYLRVKQLANEAYTDEQRFKFVSWLLSWGAPLLFNVSVEVENAHYLDEVETGVIFGNHQSNFDIIALLKGIKRRHGYVSKKELDHIFLLSDAMRLIKCEFMDRTDVRQSVKVISSAAKTAATGHLMVIFPEGTREINASVGTFKAGSFKLAQKAKAAIIPITIFNSYEVEKRFPRRTKIKIKVHQPMTYDMYSHLSTNEICEQVERIIKAPLMK